jgi:hypothetical protein
MKKMQKTKKQPFNMYEWMHKRKKRVVTVISFMIVASMLLGTFMQFFRV